MVEINDHGETERRTLASIKRACLQRGAGGIKGLACLFRRFDTDFSKTISPGEFVHGLQKFGVKEDEQELRRLFAFMDRDGNGCLDFREFLTKLSGPMSRDRVHVIDEAFDKMDADGNGILQVCDLMSLVVPRVTYKDHLVKHPRYISGEWSADQVLRTFLDTFDNPDDKDGSVTRQEFQSYYAGVSCTVADDHYFDLLMRSSWGLPPKQRHHHRLLRGGTGDEHDYEDSDEDDF